MEFDYEKLKPQLTFFATIETIGLLIGGVVNLLLLTFHLKQSNKSTTILLYCLMNGTDLLICILMIPTVISCWAGSKPLFFESLVAREIWLFLWEVSGRTSVFLIGLQSVLRTRALLFPFSRRIGKVSLAGIVITYTIILCCIKSTHLFYKIYSIFSPRTTRATFFFTWLQRAMGAQKSETAFYMFLNNLFGYVIPFLPITISCIISVYCIRKSRRATYRRRSSRLERSAKKPTQDQHRTATVTILILTIVYIVTNAPIFVLELNEMMIGLSITLQKNIYFINWTVFIQSGHILEYVFIYVTCYNVCILLNSALNGFVFLLRTASIREYIAKNFKKTVKNCWGRQAGEEGDLVLTNRTVSVGLGVTELSKAETVL